MWEYRSGKPLVFTHVPRTAGTSLVEAVKASIEPRITFTGYGRAMLGSFSDVDSLHRSIRDRMALTPDELPADAEFISGHIAPSVTRARFPDSDHFTVLREPRVRLISNWLFARAHSDFNLRRWRGLGAWMRAARSHLFEYLNNPLAAVHTDNGTVRLLLWPHEQIPDDDFIDPAHDDELLDEAVALLDSFAYTGIVEDPCWVADLGRWLGQPLNLPRVNEVDRLRQPEPPDLATEASGNGGEALRWRGRIDARLWEHVAARTSTADASSELRERSFRDAIERYSALVREPVRLSYPRRFVERYYRLVTRVRASG